MTDKRLMIDERLTFLLEALNLNLRLGQEPQEAWKGALDDYAYVYFTDDGRTPLARASERALKQLKEHDKNNDDEGPEVLRENTEQVQ